MLLIVSLLKSLNLNSNVLTNNLMYYHISSRPAIDNKFRLFKVSLSSPFFVNTTVKYVHCSFLFHTYVHCQFITIFCQIIASKTSCAHTTRISRCTRFTVRRTKNNIRENDRLFLAPYPIDVRMCHILVLY